MKLDNFEKNPVIISGSHHIAILLLRHHHDLLKHLACHLTEGAVKSAGLWITGGKRRGKVSAQKVADLPADRHEPAPPFTNVGGDVFGPWKTTRREYIFQTMG